MLTIAPVLPPFRTDGSLTPYRIVKLFGGSLPHGFFPVPESTLAPCRKASYPPWQDHDAHASQDSRWRNTGSATSFLVGCRLYVKRGWWPRQRSTYAEVPGLQARGMPMKSDMRRIPLSQAGHLPKAEDRHAPVAQVVACTGAPSCMGLLVVPPGVGACWHIRHLGRSLCLTLTGHSKCWR
jgi:hypothetical protein